MATALLQVDHELIARKVRADRLHLLFRQSMLATVGSFVAACILAHLHWPAGDQGFIGLWLTVQGACSVLRLAMFLAYFRATPERRGWPDWERVYWATLVLSASVWGFGALMVMSPDSLQSQVTTLFFATGMAGSAVSSYSAYRSMTLVAAGLVLLPTSLWVLMQPFATQRLLALTALLFSFAVVRTTKELSNALQKALRLTHEMDLAHRVASVAAQTDELTGVHNRRAFFERAEQLLRYCRRNQRPLCALVMDIDHFKPIHDTRGHQAGDEVLRGLGRLLLGSFREADVCGRLGGEEFAVLLADTGPEAAVVVADKLRQAIEALALDAGAGGHVTVSVGVAEAHFDADDLRGLLHRADAAMYAAKAGGRNRVERLAAPSLQSGH